MTFPRLAIHTGNTVIQTNKHPNWLGVVVLQHNETTTTMLSYGPRMTSKAKKRHPLFSTFQSQCDGAHWADYGGEFLGSQVVNGQVVSPDVDGLEVVTTAIPFGQRV